MKLITWNVNGVRARQAEVIELLRKEEPDVLCLQETKASPEQVPAHVREVAGYWSYWHGFKGYSGVALLVSKDFCDEAPNFEHPGFNMENRIVTANINGTTIASVYVPNGGKDFVAKMQFFSALTGLARDAAGTAQSLLICGDLNIAHRPEDVHPSQRRAVIGQLPQERAAFDELLGHDLVDVGRTQAPDDDRLFTWWAPWRGLREKNVGWRLDYVLASRPLAQRVTCCTVNRGFGTSDHGPLVVVFGESKARGKRSKTEVEEGPESR